MGDDLLFTKNGNINAQINLVIHLQAITLGFEGESRTCLLDLARISRPPDGLSDFSRLVLIGKGAFSGSSTPSNDRRRDLFPLLIS